MEKSLVVALAIISVVVFAPSASAAADPFKLPVEVKVAKQNKPKSKPQEIKPPLAPVIKEHVVVEGDTLTTISQAHGLDWIRLWQKNTGIANPDILNIGDKLVIPEASEVLADRPLPVAPVQNTSPAPIQVPVRGVIPGNGYDYGNCTWYVKNRRADIGNFWGNADQWSYSARAAGYLVDSSPSVGSIGVATSYMHVVFLEAVDGNRVYVSEMNYEGFGIVSSRWTDASEFTYIH